MIRALVPIRVTLLLLALVLGMPAVAANADGPVHQVRIYRIHPGNERAFHERFRDHAMRIMAKHGFRIVATWESKRDEGTEFVYLLEWPDEATLTSGWAAFMADGEWSAIKRETGSVHGTFVDGIEDRTLKRTDYSPTRSF